jgi:replicative DNA helicase Mcm
LDYRSIDVSAEEEQSILEESKKSNHLDRLIMSIAPSIKGNYNVKLGLLMQQVEGSTSRLPDGSISRGSIHILLVGDPSMGKSVLLQYTSKLSPKCAMGAGGGASGVGITASVEKDRQEGWVLEAGVLPMANGGIAIVDEFDKLRDDDKAKLHEALEQGQIHVDKASVHAVLPTNCSLLAAANPKMGRFDKYDSLTKQVNLAPALLSRFDLIFLLLDRPDPSRDEEIAKHILVDAHKVDPVLDQEFLRKYLAYARRLKPTLSQEASKRLIDHYTNIRKNTSNGIPILPRALHSLRRLAEASAKLRLSQIVTLEDADRAIKVYNAAFDPLISNEIGDLDSDIVNLGSSKLDRDRVRLFKDIISSLSVDGGATILKIQEEADEASIPHDDAMEILRRLKKAGDVMEIRPGIFALSS